jgi:hypothetical protein
MLTKAIYSGNKIAFDFWSEVWAPGTLREPHLLTATQQLIQEGHEIIDLFHDMSATETLPRMMTITHTSMSGYANMIGNFGQVIIPPLRPCPKKILKIGDRRIGSQTREKLPISAVPRLLKNVRSRVDGHQKN